LRDNLFTGIEVKGGPAKDEDGQIMSGMVNYSIEIVINGTHFFSAWKMGTEEQRAADIHRIEMGIVDGVTVRERQ